MKELNHPEREWSVTACAARGESYSDVILRLAEASS